MSEETVVVSTEKVVKVRKPRVVLNVDDGVFAAKWNEVVGAGGKAVDVEKALGMPDKSALPHSMRLRKKGLNLVAGKKGRRKGVASKVVSEQSEKRNELLAAVDG